MAIGGQSWSTAGKIWYQSLTGFAPSPALTMKAFANRTRTAARQLFPKQPAVKTAVDAAWKGVGL